MKPTTEDPRREERQTPKLPLYRDRVALTAGTEPSSTSPHMASQSPPFPCQFLVGWIKVSYPPSNTALRLATLLFALVVPRSPRPFPSELACCQSQAAYKRAQAPPVDSIPSPRLPAPQVGSCTTPQSNPSFFWPLSTRVLPPC